MIILPNAIYLHVPKTAGTSFEEMMKDRHGVPATGFHDPAADVPPHLRHQHDTARDIPQSLRHLWIFGFMRDPMLAAYSDFRYHVYSWKPNENFTFENWLRWRHEEEKDYGRQFGITEEQLDWGYRFNIGPQAGYFCDETGKCIANRIFRFEKLTEATQEIGEVVGMDCSLQGTTGMVYSWSKGREDYNDKISDEARAILRRAKGIDFMLYQMSDTIRTDFRCPTWPTYMCTRPN